MIAGSGELEGLLGAILPLLVRAVDSDDDAQLDKKMARKLSGLSSH